MHPTLILVRGLFAAGTAANNPLGSGWLIAVVLAIPTSLLGYAAYRAQAGRDERTQRMEEQAQRVEAEKEAKEREAELERARAADQAEQNARLRILHDTQQRTIEMVSERLAAEQIEGTRLRALNLDAHERETHYLRDVETMRNRLRDAEQQRDEIGRMHAECARTIHQLKLDLQHCLEGNA